ncbi:MAG: DOMON-like domain-containing protein [Gammaproteobacteria bacterium]
MSASPDITHPLHPFALPSEAPVRALAASAEADGEGALRFRYVLDADLSAVRIPAARPSARADELWKHTCFEAFISGPSHGDEYRELNFSPSMEWAAYSFESYRKGMAGVSLPSAPRIEVTRTGSQLVVNARIGTRGLLPESWRASDAKLRIALSAVIEDESGRLSYWALKHAPDKPDFHHAAGFILEV